MNEEGQYIYCIIGTDEARGFGPIGIGGRGDEVVTIPCRDLSAVVSDSPVMKYAVSWENLMAHTKVIEEVMKDHTVLPVRFCTIAKNAEEVRGLLERRYGELKSLLQYMDNKIEMGVKAIWKDMDPIFREIVEEHEGIKRLKEKILRSPGQSYGDRIAIGELVQKALEVKRRREGEQILDILKRLSIDHCVNKTYGDRLLFNAAFLIDKAREKEFDDQVEELTVTYDGRIQFKYVGPVPPFNFVNLTLHVEEE